MKWMAGGLVAAVLVATLFVAAAVGALGVSVAPPVTTAAGWEEIPPPMAALYREAAARFGIPAPILAAIGKVECDHGTDPACAEPNDAGAVGPMQFLPGTFARYGWASGDPEPSIDNASDAVFAAAALLAANGVNADPAGAIFAYNHSQAYVEVVESWAFIYGWDPTDAEGAGS